MCCISLGQFQDQFPELFVITLTNYINTLWGEDFPGSSFFWKLVDLRIEFKVDAVAKTLGHKT